jgi:hypothetical protein
VAPGEAKVIVVVLKPLSDGELERKTGRPADEAVI